MNPDNTIDPADFAERNTALDFALRYPPDSAQQAVEDAGTYLAFLKGDQPS